MAIKDIIACGIGFSPGSVKFIITHGFNTSLIVSGGISLTGVTEEISFTGVTEGTSLTAKSISSQIFTGVTEGISLTAKSIPNQALTGELETE